MVKIGYDEMNKLIADGSAAFDYAWAHYEELKSRPAAYTLYGLKAHHIGAASPSHLTKSNQRALKHSTRRREYSVYELDDSFNVLRVKHVKNQTEIECTYHFFELNNVLYACPFFKDEKRFYKKSSEAIKYSNGVPVWYAQTSPNQLCAEFYEYITNDLIITTAYLFYPKSKITPCGESVVWDAPFGAPNSPVQVSCFEGSPRYIDFAEWF